MTEQAEARRGRPSRRAAILRMLAMTMLAPVSVRTAPAAAPRWRVPFGAAVRPDLLASDAAYRDAILRTCSIVVPEGSLKWPVIRPTQDGYHFAEGDAYVAFAQAHGLLARGHTLVWGEVMPDWTRGIGAGEAEGVLTDYIETVAGRYAGRIASWDVVNEPLAADPSTPSDLRASIWLATLGPRYIDIAFRLAAAADPHARRVLNDYDIEYATPAARMKRAGVLALVRGLVDRNVPIQAVGLQGHLHGERPIDRDGLSGFVRDLRALGVGVVVTELDVIDDGLPRDTASRDAAVAAQADAFLGAIFEAATPEAVLTWGISDRFTWVPTYFRRADGTPNRPLPLDADYRPKPLLRVLERYCA